MSVNRKWSPLKIVCACEDTLVPHTHTHTSSNRTVVMERWVRTPVQNWELLPPSWEEEKEDQRKETGRIRKEERKRSNSDGQRGEGGGGQKKGAIKMKRIYNRWKHLFISVYWVLTDTINIDSDLLFIHIRKNTPPPVLLNSSTFCCCVDDCTQYKSYIVENKKITVFTNSFTPFW